GDPPSPQDADNDRPPADPRPAPDLRVRLADRSLLQTNPILGVVAQLVDLAGGRLSASEVLDLADREPVRRRLRLGDDDLARLQAAVDALSTPQAIDAWARAIAAAAEALTATTETESWQWAELERLLGDVVAEAAGNPTRVALPEVRALLAERLAGRPTRAN